MLFNVFLAALAMTASPVPASADYRVGILPEIITSRDGHPVYVGSTYEFAGFVTTDREPRVLAKRLQSLSQDLAGTSADLTRTFTFNPASQMQSQSSSNDAYAWTAHHNASLAYTVNGLNQLTAAGATAFSHDARGWGRGAAG